MTIWQIIYLAWMALGLGVVLASHGKPRTGNYSFWTSLVSTALQIMLLYFGGFFG